MSKTAECKSQELAWDFYTYAYSYDGSSNLEYLGRASIGSIKSAAVWQVVKFTYSGANLTDKQWASKGSFENVWDDRAGLSYS